MVTSEPGEEMRSEQREQRPSKKDVESGEGGTARSTGREADTAPPRRKCVLLVAEKQKAHV